MIENKALRIVIVYPNEIDAQELARIKTAVQQATGEDLRPICPTGSTLVFFANADFDVLFKSIDGSRAIGTQVFIGTLSVPCTTIGFSPSLAKIQKHLRGKSPT